MKIKILLSFFTLILVSSINDGTLWAAKADKGGLPSQVQDLQKTDLNLQVQVDGLVKQIIKLNQVCPPHKAMYGIDADGKILCAEYYYNFHTKKIVFLSSEKYSADLGGIVGANSKCQYLANQAGLNGTFKAWISTEEGDPKSTFNTEHGLPYVLMDGTIVANNWDDLTTIKPDDYTGTYLRASINITEKNEVIDYYLDIWTNTKPDGSRNYRDDIDCQGYTRADVFLDRGRIGQNHFVSAEWTDGGNTSCDVENHIYCFQQ